MELKIYKYLILTKFRKELNKLFSQDKDKVNNFKGSDVIVVIDLEEGSNTCRDLCMYIKIYAR